jgi:hypothetical protein
MTGEPSAAVVDTAQKVGIFGHTLVAKCEVQSGVENVEVLAVPRPCLVLPVQTAHRLDAHVVDLEHHAPPRVPGCYMPDPLSCDPLALWPSSPFGRLRHEQVLKL